MEIRKQNRIFLLLLFCIITAFSNGCAIIKAPTLRSNTSAIDVSRDSIVLFTLKIVNEYKPNFQPIVKLVAFENDKKERFYFGADLFKEVENSYTEHLLSVNLPPGNYKLLPILAHKWILTSVVEFKIPIYSSFSLPPQKIVYLGHIEATIKERTDEKQLRGGSVGLSLAPVIAGASGGTFVVNITDNFEDDIKLYKQKFQYLSQYQVENQTLRQWTETDQ